MSAALCPPTPTKTNITESPISKNPPSIRPRTDKTTAALNGKIKSLKKLMNYPRASVPEFKNWLQQLLDYFNNVLTNVSKTKVSTKALEERLRSCKHLEEVVIRIIVIEEDVESVWKSILEREQKNKKEESSVWIVGFFCFFMNKDVLVSSKFLFQ